jgi:hypothetical protein
MIVLTTAAFALYAGSASQAQFTLNWHTLDGGGHTFSTGGPFSLGGTIGQPDAGPVMIGGNFALIGGFWPGAGGVPCPPDLDGDGIVGQGDLGIVLAAWGTCPGQPGYHPGAGMLAPGDPCVTQADLGVLLAAYGQVCP